MSNPPPENPSANNPPSGAPAGAAATPLDLEMQVRGFWEKNRKAIYFFCAAVILVILARSAWDWLAARRQAGIQAAYAAATTSEQLRVFAREHGGHSLAGAAYLKLADEAYAAERYDEALGDYEKAAAALPGTPFAARAALGGAICLIQAGKNTEGTAALRQIADDAAQLRTARCEAVYHLAALAFADGDYDEARKRTEQVIQLDSRNFMSQRGSWAQRALMLSMRIPPPAEPAESAPAGTKDEAATMAEPVSAPPAEKKDAAALEPVIKLPGS